MELVYLWVDDYKNIHKQGFNFSPKFQCEFNYPDLIINKKDNYIPDFFGENIDVTAIVGKNGAGKSSIQKFIFMIIFFNKYKDLKKDDKKNNIDQMYRRDACSYIGQFFEGKGFLILKKCNRFYIAGIKNIDFNYSDDVHLLEENRRFHILNKITCEGIKLKELNSNSIDFFSTHFNYMIDTWIDDQSADKWVRSIYHRVDGYVTPLLLEPYKGHDKQFIDIDNLEFLNIQKLLVYLRDIKESEIIAEFFTPNQIQYSYKQLNRSGSHKILQKIERISQTYRLPDGIKDKLKEIIKEFYKENKLKELNRSYIVLKAVEEKEGNLFNKDSYKKIKDSLTNNDSNLFVNLLNELDFSNFLIRKDYYKTQKIGQAIKFDKIIDSVQQSFLNHLDQEVSFKAVRDFIGVLPPWLYIELYQNTGKVHHITHENKKNYHSLSSGEKQILSLIVNLIYQVKNIISDGKYETINIFLDETEFGLHPSWQKKYVNILLTTLKQFEIKIHLIFATHSPFLLSDIPKSNIIFLDSYTPGDSEVKNDTQKIGNCKVVGGTKKLTLGANIHTLLSDSFFMEDGLIGEFVKEKIERVIKLLRSKSEKVSFDEAEKIISLKEAEKIINVLGEPILKRRLECMLDKFKLDFKKKTDTDIKNEIEKHEKKIQELKKRINKND